MHQQVWAKVNAPVDKGVCGIVSALSAFESLETVESCEGGDGRGPWVCFRFGAYWRQPWQELADFVLGFLGPGLSARVGDDATVRIQMTPGGQIFGELSVRPGAEERVEAALRELALDFSAYRRRNSACCDGTSGTCQ